MLLSMRDRFHARQVCALRNPLLVAFERQSKQIVGNAHIAVSAERHRLRRHGLHFLRHHADISGVAAVVDEAIVSEAVVEPPEQHDIVLEAHIGAPPAAPATSSPMAPVPAAAPAPAVEAATAAPAVEAAGASASEAARTGAADASSRPRRPACVTWSCCRSCAARAGARAAGAWTISRSRAVARPW